MVQNLEHELKWELLNPYRPGQACMEEFKQRKQDNAAETNARLLANTGALPISPRMNSLIHVDQDECMGYTIPLQLCFETQRVNDKPRRCPTYIYR